MCHWSWIMKFINVIRKRGASCVAKLSAILEPRALWLGSKSSEVEDNLPLVHLAFKRHRRYSLVELLKGATPESVEALMISTAWSLEGDSVGEELL